MHVYTVIYKRKRAMKTYHILKKVAALKLSEPLLLILINVCYYCMLLNNSHSAFVTIKPVANSATGSNPVATTSSTTGFTIT